ncbi:hypothetical protein ATG71_4128 [Bacillus sp. es.034]|nr:hypothetical protein ATG71_4128 [Bacillus sp. es.034]
MIGCFYFQVSRGFLVLKIYEKMITRLKKNHISSKNPHPFAKIKEMDCHELRFNSAL